MSKKAAPIIFSKDLNVLELSNLHKNKNYVWFEATKTFVFKPKLRDIKTLLDEGKSISEINQIFLNEE